MSRIYWDTMIFVYWLEDHPVYGDRISQILAGMQARGDILYTSAFTLGEILVAPYKQRDERTAERIRAVFRSRDVTVWPFTDQAAEYYGRIRAELRVAPADAIHLACAAEVGTDLFLTNDANLVGRVVPGIKLTVGLQTKLL